MILIPFCLAEFLHGGEPLSEVAFLGEAVVVGGQLEQLDLSDYLKLLQEQKENQMRSETVFNQPEALKKRCTFLLFSKLIRPPWKHSRIKTSTKIKCQSLS